MQFVHFYKLVLIVMCFTGLILTQNDLNCQCNYKTNISLQQSRYHIFHLQDEVIGYTDCISGCSKESVEVKQGQENVQELYLPIKQNHEKIAVFLHIKQYNKIYQEMFFMFIRCKVKSMKRSLLLRQSIEKLYDKSPKPPSWPVPPHICPVGAWVNQGGEGTGPTWGFL